MGVMVENGIVKEGTPICVPSKEVSVIKVYVTIITINATWSTVGQSANFGILLIVW